MHEIPEINPDVADYSHQRHRADGGVIGEGHPGVAGREKIEPLSVFLGRQSESSFVGGEAAINEQPMLLQHVLQSGRIVGEHVLAQTSNVGRREHHLVGQQIDLQFVLHRQRLLQALSQFAAERQAEARAIGEDSLQCVGVEAE